VALFLDGTVELSGVEVEGMAEHEKVAFWVNTWHLLLIHAFLVLGPPTSSKRWGPFYNRMCYEIGGTCISLSEIEHCILRAPLSTPKTWLGLAAGLVPKWHPDDPRRRLALTVPEPRVNLVLNCGSLAYPSYVVVYTPDHIDMQLKEACRVFLDHTVSINVKEREISLPKVCEWYAKDFGFTNLDCVRYMQKLIGLQKSKQLRDLLPEARDAGGRTRDAWQGRIKFSGMEWECQHAFVELMTEWSVLFSEKGLEEGRNERFL